MHSAASGLLALWFLVFVYPTWVMSLKSYYCSTKTTFFKWETVPYGALGARLSIIQLDDDRVERYGKTLAGLGLGQNMVLRTVPDCDPADSERGAASARFNSTIQPSEP